MAAFAELGLMPEIVQAVEDLDWIFPTAVQAEAIPLVLGGGDVCVAAPTGSGKTGAFCLPTLQIVHETLNYAPSIGEMTTADAAEPRRWAMSSSDRDPHLVLDSDGVTCTSRELHQWSGARAALGIRPSTSGRWYYEVWVQGDGLCRVGWSAAGATLALGEDEMSFGFGGTGKKSHQGKFETYGATFGKNDVIGTGLDWQRQEIWFSKNGQCLGRAFVLDREQLGDRALYPHIYLKNSQVRVVFTDTSGRPDATYREVGSAAPSEVTTPHLEGTVDLQGIHRPPNAPLMLILEPTRELALQVYQEICHFARCLNTGTEAGRVHCAMFVGGSGNRCSDGSSASGRIDIAVCTPGRLFEAIKNKQLDVRAVRFLALDEVDALLAAGCAPQIMQLLGMIPRHGRRHRLQIIMFSATLNSPQVRQLSDRIQENAIWVDVRGPETVPSTLDHILLRLDPKTALQLIRETDPSRLPGTDQVHLKTNIEADDAASLSQRVKLAKPVFCLRLIELFQMDQAMIFCRTQLDCDLLHQFMEQHDATRGASATLHAGLADFHRRQNFGLFKEGQVRYLICTDVAARGIDVVGLPFLISLTMPEETENYLHRIGRVGRADRLGLAISLVSTVPEQVWYHRSCRNRARGKCQNRALTSEGGCTIWYDEPELARRLEEHLGEANMPEILDASAVLQMTDLAGLRTFIHSLAHYGKKKAQIESEKKGELDSELRQQIDYAKSVSGRVQQLEKNVQLRFLQLLQRS
jgi:ATP-dependent RNA helicase DDX1